LALVQFLPSTLKLKTFRLFFPPLLFGFFRRGYFPRLL
jgi:hypothetical protein